MAKLHPAVSSNDHALGPDDAPVTLVEFGDYQCPSCGEAAPVVKKLVKHFGAKLRFVFRNFPLEQHEFAQAAAEAAEYAATEGDDSFWAMHDALYAHQDEFSPALFAGLAKKVGVDASGLTKAIESEQFSERIERDMASGESSGLRGTPTFYLNGTMLDANYDYDSLKDAVDAAL